ncbi:MAG: hypothetical protein AAF212_03175 [Verrucomicrobiota bacterium]
MKSRNLSISCIIILFVLPRLCLGYADEEFEISKHAILYRFTINEDYDISRVSGELIKIVSRNEIGETRVRYIRADRLQSITKKTDGPPRLADKYIGVAFTPEKTIVGGQAIYTSIELKIDERILSLDEVISLLNP